MYMYVDTQYTEHIKKKFKKVNASKKVNTATLPYLTFTFTYLLLLYPMLPYTTFTTFTYIPRGGTGVIPP